MGADPIDDLHSAGLAVARVPASASRAEELRRAQVARAAARKNLAAVAVDEFGGLEVVSRDEALQRQAAGRFAVIEALLATSWCPAEDGG